jgi:hypothetical protein
MAGLYRRGVQRNAGTPLMQVQGSQGAGGAVPRGGGLPAASQDDAKTSENVQKLGGLLGMLAQQKQAQQDIAPAVSAAEQTTAATSALPDPSQGVGFAPSPSLDGKWGGVQTSAFGSGIPTPSGDYQFNGGAGAGMGLSSTPSMGGVALPTAGAPAGPINVGQNFALAGQGANAAAMNAGKTVAEVQPQGFLDMLQNGWGAVKGFFGGGAGA